MRRARWALAAVGLGLAVQAAGPGAARAEGCHPAMPVIRSEAGQVFAADAHARIVWRERSSGGRLFDYGRQIWRGRIDGRLAFLTFDEIPGTSGPNHGMGYQLGPQRARPDWRQTGTRYDLGARFIIRGGALGGEWTVTNCR